MSETAAVPSECSRSGHKRGRIPMPKEWTVIHQPAAATDGGPGYYVESRKVGIFGSGKDGELTYSAGCHPTEGGAMGSPVRYIPKTHEYYRRLGYPFPYKYARFDTTPFAPLHKPLGRCRVGLVATAGVTLLDDEGRPAPMKVMGGEEANVVAIASD